MVSKPTIVCNTSNHLLLQTIQQQNQITAYSNGNRGHDLGQAQKCCGVKTVNGIPTPFFDNRISFILNLEQD